MSNKKENAGEGFELSTVLTQFNGDPIPTERDGSGELTLGDALRNALGASGQGLKPDEKLKRYKIGMKCIADEGEVKLNNTEIGIALKAVNDAYPSPIIYGRVAEILDPNSLTNE